MVTARFLVSFIESIRSCVSYFQYIISGQEEFLLLRCRKSSYWKNNRIEKCIEEISPRRKIENHKSTWAVKECTSDCTTTNLTSCRSLHREYQELELLHAASLYLLHERQRDPSKHPKPRSKIEGVLIERSAFKYYNILKDEGHHILESCKKLHRSIRITTPETRKQRVEHILETNKYKTWRYTRQQVQNKLEDLVREECMDKKYISDCVACFGNSWRGLR